jgi:hypothetical protein
MAIIRLVTLAVSVTAPAFSERKGAYRGRQSFRGDGIHLDTRPFRQHSVITVVERGSGNLRSENYTQVPVL